MEEADEKRLAEVSEVTKVLADTQILTPEDAVLELLSRGYSRARAEKLYFFVELAFGRMIIVQLEEIEFPETYIVESADGKQTEYTLTDDPYYADAVHVAYCLIQNKVNEIVRSVALRSAELSAFSNALESSAKLEGAEFYPPRWTSALYSSDWENLS